MTVGTVGETRALGNTRLVEHGIQTEQSDLRAHVCPVARKVYVYPTKRGLEAIDSGKFRSVPGYQDGIKTATAKGYLVPPFEIKECVAISLRAEAWDYLKFSEHDTLSSKGHKAEKLILQMLKRGLFPVPALPDTVTDKDIQIRGADIIIKAGKLTRDDIVIQVKCDYRGGERSDGGTGNLFLQTEECNPFGYT